MQQMRRFLAVGVISTAIDYLIYAALLYFDLTTTNIAIIIGYTSGFIFSFIATRSYVFSQIKVDRIHREFIFVTLIAAAGLGLNILIVQGAYALGLDLYSARVVAIGIVFFFNFYARKVFVYG